MKQSAKTTQPRIGIVDDEASVRRAVEALLREHGFQPVPMASAAGYHALSEPLDLVLIDLRLRGDSGLDLARSIRQTSDLPIVMLTGRGDETDKIIGLEIGADDYLLKPFNPRELVARVRAVLRRSGRAGPDAPTVESRHAIGKLSVDQVTRTLLDERGDEIALTNAEYRLLDYLLSRRGEIVSRADLLEELGGDLTRYMDRTVDVLILRLRRKIESNPSKPVHLQTRRGRGYVLSDAEE